MRKLCRSPNLKWSISFSVINKLGASKVALVVKKPPANAGDVRDEGSIPGFGRCPVIGNGNSLQYFCLQNFMDRGAWWATVYGVTKSWIWLSACAHTHTISYIWEERENFWITCPRLVVKCLLNKHSLLVLMLGKIEGRREKGTTENEMVGWHHQLNGHEFEQTSEDDEGQGSLVFCRPWGCKEVDTTEWLNNKISI